MDRAEESIDKLVQEWKEAMSDMQKEFAKNRYVYSKKIETIDNIQEFAKSRGLTIAPNGLELGDRSPRGQHEKYSSRRFL